MGWRSAAGVGAVAVLLGVACGDDAAAPIDAGTDAEAARDAGPPDAGPPRDARPASCPPPLGAAAPWTPPGAAHAHPLDDVLRVSDLQMEGSHNSYHVAMEGTIDPWMYTHAPLDEQYESQGVRAIELDVWWQPRCDRYRVYHHPIVDDATTCDWFTDCLAIVRAWSDAHPGHHPLFVQLEIKQEHDAATAAAELDALDAELLSIFRRESLLTPDDLLGTHASIRAALDADGWPTLGAARGRVVFLLDNRGDGFSDTYTHDRTDLAGRVAFAPGSPSDTWAAVAVLNDPVPDATAIRTHAEAGLIVRTRADTDGVEARANDRTRLDAALASGAHIISTDFPAPVTGLDYSVEVPDGTPSRCNPLTAPMECTSSALEDPSLLAP